MGSSDEKTNSAVLSAVEEYNTLQNPDQRLAVNPATVLFSRAGFTKPGNLDSMGLINLLVIVEDKMKLAFGQGYVLDIPFLLREKENHLKDIRSLVTFLTSSLT